MSQIAKWRSMLRLCDIFTNGTVKLTTVIDGERQYYKIFRDEGFRQIRHRGQARPTRPFRPFTTDNTFHRGFSGNSNSAKMFLTPSDGERFNRTYQPIDNTGPPGEVVRTEIWFTLGDETVHLEYDTGEIVISDGIRKEYEDDGINLTRILDHRLPLVKVECYKESTAQENDKPKGYSLPKDWIAFLGTDVFVSSTFEERVNEHVSLTGMWNGSATMKSFQLNWNLKLSEWCCSSAIIDMFKMKPAVRTVVSGQQP
jgi:hypothetical protein